jgi:S-adenosyl-L-methionine hydrolase (adenosine-forming)
MGQSRSVRSPESGRQDRPASQSAGKGIGEDAWKPSGIVTLLTDFGTDDPYVGIMKGVLLTDAPGSVVVDLTHGVPPHSVRIGAWFLSHAYGFFPPGTVHVAVVDPGVGSVRKLLVASDHGYVFLAPDNGLLGPILSPEARIFELDGKRFARKGTSRTFHGRDVLAPAAAAIARGLAPAETGVRMAELQGDIAFPRSRTLAPGRIECEVLLADRYGNLILSARPEDLEGDPEGWIVETTGRKIPLRGAYAEAAPGELLALVDSYGAIEIAVREGSAAGRLGLRPGDCVTLARNA